MKNYLRKYLLPFILFAGFAILYYSFSFSEFKKFSLQNMDYFFGADIYRVASFNSSARDFLIHPFYIIFIRPLFILLQSFNILHPWYLLISGVAALCVSVFWMILSYSISNRVTVLLFTLLFGVSFTQFFNVTVVETFVFFQLSLLLLCLYFFKSYKNNTYNYFSMAIIGVLSIAFNFFGILHFASMLFLFHWSFGKKNKSNGFKFHFLLVKTICTFAIISSALYFLHRSIYIQDVSNISSYYINDVTNFSFLKTEFNYFYSYLNNLLSSLVLIDFTPGKTVAVQQYFWIFPVITFMVLSWLGFRLFRLWKENDIFFLSLSILLFANLIFFYFYGSSNQGSFLILYASSFFFLLMILIAKFFNDINNRVLNKIFTVLLALSIPIVFSLNKSSNTQLMNLFFLLNPNHIHPKLNSSKLFPQLMKAKKENILDVVMVDDLKNKPKYFYFGLGKREKFIFKENKLISFFKGDIFKDFGNKTTAVILPEDFTVKIYDEYLELIAQIIEDEKNVRIETFKNENSETNILPNTEIAMSFPNFENYEYSHIMTVLMHEVLFTYNAKMEVFTPSLEIYRDKPWHRDLMIQAMVLKKVGNLELLKKYILNLRDPYNRYRPVNEPDNLGNVLYLISLYSDKNHPLVKSIIKEAGRITDKNKCISGYVDYRIKDQYPTQLLIYGLKQLGLFELANFYNINCPYKEYENILWFTNDKKELDIPSKNNPLKNLNFLESNRFSTINDVNPFPYLQVAASHRLVNRGEIGARPLILNNTYPLSWGDGVYLHAWHAAELFLYLEKFKLKQ